MPNTIESLVYVATNRNTTEDNAILALTELNSLSLNELNWKEISQYQRTLLRLLASPNETIQSLAAEVLSHSSGAVTKHSIQIVKVQNMEISIRQETDKSENGVGWRLWDSSKILSEYIITHKEIFAHKNILEVGGGCGLTGIVAAHFAKRVVFSDYITTLVDNIAHNVSLNFPPESSVVPDTEAVLLDWNEIDDASHCPSLARNSFDIIIGTDVVYDQTNPPLLAQVVMKFLKEQQGACAYFVLPVIRKNVLQFLEAMTKTALHCEVEKVFYPPTDADIIENNTKQFYFCKYSVK